MNKLPTHRISLPKINKNLERGYGKIPVEIIKPWGGYSVGAVIKPTGIVRGWLIDTGRAKVYEEKPAPPVRGRPRKRKDAD